ncbi:MAG: RCC1 domain-containing protein, partial [Myxococcaceae bacterium]
MVQRVAVVGLCLLTACGSSSSSSQQPPPVTGTDIDPTVSGPLATALNSQSANLSGASALGAQGAALALQAGVQADSVNVTASALATPPRGNSSELRSSSLASGPAFAFAFQITLASAPGSLSTVYSGVLMFQGATDAVLAAGVSPGGSIPSSIGLILTGGQLWAATSGQEGAQFVENTGVCPFTGTLPAFVTACTTATFSNAGFVISGSQGLFGAIGSQTASLANTALVGVALTVDCSKTSLCGTSSTGVAWATVSAGSNNCLGVKADGTLWTWGDDNTGELGNGTTSTQPQLRPLQISTGYALVASGNLFDLAIAGSGTLWAWGSNEYGTLGDGTTTNRNAPVQIGTDTNWFSVSAGFSHTMAIKQDGTLWAWGDNREGQLGDGSLTQRNAPEQIGTDTNWESVSAGAFWTAAIKNDGTLWTWGTGSYGDLGNGSGTDTSQTVPAQVGTDKNWLLVSAGWTFGLAVKGDFTLWAWGNNANGQLGDGTT